MSTHKNLYLTLNMCTGKFKEHCATQRFVPDSLKLRTARFEHAHRWFAEQSHIDHAIK